MKKHSKIITTIKVLGLVFFIIYIFSMTPNIALRTAIFFHSPKSAFTMEYEEIAKDKKSSTTIYNITKNYPETNTGPLPMWQVKKIFIFYFTEVSDGAF